MFKPATTQASFALAQATPVPAVGDCKVQVVPPSVVARMPSGPTAQPSLALAKATPLSELVLDVSMYCWCQL